MNDPLFGCQDNVIGSIKELSVERVKALMDEITKWQHQYHEQQKTTHELQGQLSVCILAVRCIFLKKMDYFMK